ncbi:hypothetical protein L249_6335 [Ophiocordyceps polyrhachis-furcata BCC 54312]|uniref:Uncharacterized protein n=1 Tax=Ophiocordyceps polyrhachis-furcata BCC 54312 TaxID=1330021 RepID=A0A367L144_9HYPO|nr:hypothetical protein L249_6335 [Ophiocordyceps polyrhachis-furcata BCC 54312]
MLGTPTDGTRQIAGGIMALLRLGMFSPHVTRQTSQQTNLSASNRFCSRTQNARLDQPRFTTIDSADVAASRKAPFTHQQTPKGMDPARGSKRNMPLHESPEQLLDVFKAAALSVTKLYKTSALVESRARTEGYQECLQDLLMLLDRENLGLRDGEGWTIRAWATERLDVRDPTLLQATESEDEVERSDRTTSPELPRTSTEPQPPAQRPAEPPTTSVVSVHEEPAPIVVPTQDAFTFQSTYPYPNIATLDLSDSRHDVPPLQAPRNSKTRMSGSKPGSRTSGHLGRGAGNKRRWDINDFFGGCLSGKDPLGNGSKRSRHA